MISSKIFTVPPPYFMLQFISRMSPQQNYLVTSIPGFRLSGPLKDADDEALQNAVIQWPKKDSNFYQAEVHVLV
jgi:hypothetical protein